MTAPKSKATTGHLWRDPREAADDSRRSYDEAIRALREQRIRAHLYKPEVDNAEECRWWAERGGGIVIHCVYVIGYEHADGRIYGPVKVGICGNIGARLAALQCGSPAALALVMHWDHSKRDAVRVVEATFHEAHADRRLKGEWFDLDPLGAILAIKEVLDDLLDGDVGGMWIRKDVLPPIEAVAP